MATAFAQMAAGAEFPAASKWDCAVETAASDSLLSEVSQTQQSRIASYYWQRAGCTLPNVVS